MAAKALSDILSNILTADSLIEWLSYKKTVIDDDVLSKKYECSQVEFVSYFLMYLREQSSRDFQVYNSETPRKNSYSRKVKSMNALTQKSSPLVKSFQNSSPSINPLDLESLRSFPSLSSCSSVKLESSEKKVPESAQNNFMQDNSNKESSEKKFRRVKLFSETVEGNFKLSDSVKKKDAELWDDFDAKNQNRFTVSTPKISKNNLLPNNTDHFNGLDVLDISPKFTSKPCLRNQSSEFSSPEINFLPPKSRSFSGDSSHRNKDNKTSCRMSLGDFILNDLNATESKKDKRVKAKKRINPVRISNQFRLNEKAEDYPDVLEELGIVGKTNFENSTEEDFEKREGDFNKDFESADGVSPISPIKRRPDLSLATFTHELKILSKIYSFLISENYCQNIMIELCFIVSLLVVQDFDKKESELDSNDKNLFGSIHNCVYFAVETLWLQRNCLLHLNLSALKLLSENVRIESFNAELKKCLVNAYCQRQSREVAKRQQGLDKTGMQGNVSFQYETDNRENFTSDLSFHSFRKQRDLFYNILEIWEANHSDSGWIFSVGLGSKIRSLLSISSDPINLLHLARLFRNQLIMSCCGENQTEEDSNEKIFQLLPGADPNKILRLRARLTSSPKRHGPCPPPDFTGHQEFYKDFILHASHSTFHEHLKNSFCDEILRLNDTDLTGDVEEEESSLDEQTEERYLQCANILKVLAKFLGFLEFLPYRGEKTFSDRIVNIHCSVRHNTLPLFDVAACLRSAIKKQKLTLTVPWVVSYLSMIDPYSAHLKIYQTVWRLLIMIYKHLKNFKNARNGFYLKLNLGWIFQLPNFPNDQFYIGLDDSNKSSSEFSEVDLKGAGHNGLDSYHFIEETVLYAMCPYLNEINVILSENTGCSVRHVRPVTTRESSFSKSLASKQLELRLEGNFLHNQSSSTRKTVEFVTERVASIAIKHLVHNVIPKIKGPVEAKLDNLTTLNVEEAETISEHLSDICFKELLSECERENWEVCSKRSDVALKVLLSSDLQLSVVETCVKIVARQAVDKVERWMQSHVTLAMVKKEFVSIIRKKFGKKISDVASGGPLESAEQSLSKSVLSKDFYRLPADGRGVVHRETAWPASQAIKTVRELICRASEGEVAPAEVESLVEGIIETVRHRNDLLPAAEKALIGLMMDLVVVCCIHSRSSDLGGLFKKLLSLLKSAGSQSHSCLERIVCPRNVAIISKEAKKKERAWENLGNLLLLLLEKEMLGKEQIETQLLSLFRNHYEKEDGNQFLKFISEFLAGYTKIYGCDKFSLLLEYMIENLNDDETKTEGLS